MAWWSKFKILNLNFYVVLNDYLLHLVSACSNVLFSFPFRDCRVVRDPQTLKSKGYGFVSFVKKPVRVLMGEASSQACSWVELGYTSHFTCALAHDIVKKLFAIMILFRSKLVEGFY